MKAAVVTGGEGALGAAVGRALAEAGYAVAAPGRAALDVCDAGSVRRFWAGRGVDVLVHAAGVIRDGPLTRMSEEDWDAVVAPSLDGAFRCGREAAARMAERGGGHVIVIGSWAARAGTVGQAAYAAAKAGMCGLAMSMAREWGAWGVQCNVVLPGFLDVGLGARASEAARETALARHVLGRFQEVGEVARFVVHLAGMRGVSGQVFQLDSRVGRWG